MVKCDSALLPTCTKTFTSANPPCPRGCRDEADLITAGSMLWRSWAAAVTWASPIRFRVGTDMVRYGSELEPTWSNTVPCWSRHGPIRFRVGADMLQYASVLHPTCSDRLPCSSPHGPLPLHTAAVIAHSRALANPHTAPSSTRHGPIASRVRAASF